MRSLVPFLGTVLLVATVSSSVLVGCSGGGAGNNATPTPAPTATPAAATPTPAPTASPKPTPKPGSQTKNYDFTKPGGGNPDLGFDRVEIAYQATTSGTVVYRMSAKAGSSRPACIPNLEVRNGDFPGGVIRDTNAGNQSSAVVTFNVVRGEQYNVVHTQNNTPAGTIETEWEVTFSDEIEEVP
jgi:hypothetical protein